MSPTEFSNYIKQRAMQQQIHHHHHHQQQHQQPGPQGPQTPGGLPVSQGSPNSRSLSPGLSAVNGHSQHAAAAAVAAADPSAYFFHQAPPPQAYHPQFPHRNIFDSAAAAAGSHGGYLAAAAAAAATDLYTGAKFPSSYLDPGTIGHQFYGGVNGAGSSNTSQNGASALGPIGSASAAAAAGTGATSTSASQQQQADKAALVDGLNNFGLGSVTPYPASNYQHLLVAN